MPTNKNAMLRYQVIDKCLRNRVRKWTWREILDKVNEALIINNPHSKGIGKTTLYDDFKNIEYKLYNLEIERLKEGKTIYLRYADPKASLTNQILSETELLHLKAAVKEISRFRGLPQFEWIYEIIPILESKIGLIEEEKEIISFEGNLDYSGMQYISVLYNAIKQRKVLNLKYQGFKSAEPFNIEIHPQYLKQHNSRWFIMSFVTDWGNKPQINALDRIISIQETARTYLATDFDWEDYFSDVVGVTRCNDPVTEIKILITGELEASYIQTKPLHHTQRKLKKAIGGYETSIFVIPNFELEKLILSYGENLKIVSPAYFKEKIASRLKKSIENYY